ncbi:MAG: response regulator [Clostridia bacterium]|nr:response regulator [Clostridia bacterium]
MARVLVVDDEPDIAMILREILEWDGYEVTVASNGVDALSRLESGVIPDLVIADLKMPRMDGKELIGEMRGSPRTARIPVILVTAAVPQADDFPPKDAYQGFVAKPFELSEILAEVSRVLGVRTSFQPAQESQ